MRDEAPRGRDMESPKPNTYMDQSISYEYICDSITWAIWNIQDVISGSTYNDHAPHHTNSQFRHFCSQKKGWPAGYRLKKRCNQIGSGEFTIHIQSISYVLASPPQGFRIVFRCTKSWPGLWNQCDRSSGSWPIHINAVGHMAST